MESKDLSREQARIVSEAIARQLAYLLKLRTRMDKRGILPGDPLYKDVANAIDAAHRLRVRLHYLSCDPGSVGGA